MKKLQTPALLSNLYRDMRDRRMLVPAIALVVALIAVPVFARQALLEHPASGNVRPGWGRQGGGGPSRPSSPGSSG